MEFTNLLTRYVIIARISSGRRTTDNGLDKKDKNAHAPICIRYSRRLFDFHSATFVTDDIVVLFSRIPMRRPSY